ncbi:Eco57I restriction-modification methylase domain-containing protein [Limnobacter sp.]|jgi:hypothetical protein|uniref:Eco57I restriction-modification methylase domain-containing protein n=1 Tax=Limnobacter sp. TaxID=2003368 RepID=UPI0039C921CA
MNQQPLEKSLRSKLENTVKAARDLAEGSARAVIEQLGVGQPKPPTYLDDNQKALRRRLRAHGRALGDIKRADDAQDTQHLVWEIAYEHWHRMLFARFLAENGLLLWDIGSPVSLEDCEALVADPDPTSNLGAKSKWELAGKLAARMLPQVFKPQSPVFEIAFAIDQQRALERLLDDLNPEVFKASDSLGWVYQFWQAKRKEEVNASEVKIGADELSAVTQLFTEPYMVDFLLHNSLGAWWVTRQPGKPCPVPLTYLRTLDDGTPAAGKFEGWPDHLKEFKLLDPCCGSGHFLVAAFLLLVPMRIAAEGLDAMDAVDAVLADNLHGLELDARCVEIAVFALALAAWRFPDENGDPLGVRADMPAPQVACCGLKVAAKPEDWMALVPDDAPNSQLMRQELRLLYSSFAQAPLLGSLLDPTRSLKNDLATSSIDALLELLGQALTPERSATIWGQSSELQDDSWDLALTAKGLLDAARLLDGRYHQVVTNVPYLARGKHSDVLRDYCEEHYSSAKADLATVFLDRCFELSSFDGCVSIVLPQNWLFLSGYKNFREDIICNRKLSLIAALGYDSFQTGLNVSPILLIGKKNSTRVSAGDTISIISVPPGISYIEKSESLISSSVISIYQLEQRENADCRILMGADLSDGIPLRQIATALKGCSAGDLAWFVRNLWEIPRVNEDWEFHQVAPSSITSFSGREEIILWEGEKGAMFRLAESVRHLNHAAQNWLRGKPNWGKAGVVVSLMGNIPACLYGGDKYAATCTTVVLHEQSDEAALVALWAFCSSKEFRTELRKLSPKMSVEVKTILDVQFDLERWKRLGTEIYPNGLPRPYSDDPTQWLFHGHPQPSSDPLQVAVARLAGYRWPAETDTAMELADEARTWIARCESLAQHTDDDGIVCLPSVRGEEPAHDRLLKLLIAAWETVQPGSWKPSLLDKLLADAECIGKGLEVWLREKFFEQHAKRFHHRPFIWHVWDGQKDGFAALVNYHQLDHKKLERLIHTYLGDWIRQQEVGVRSGVDGAPTRLAAAQDLKRRLELILEGEPPYDIFVRWKKLSEQPIGWNPDLNDGVRLNIRPFMIAEVLRHNRKPKLNITWDKDRGKDVESAPWFKVFGGDRINHHHLTLSEKLAARTEQDKVNGK